MTKDEKGNRSTPFQSVLSFLSNPISLKILSAKLADRVQSLGVTFTATMTVDYKRALFSGLMHNSDKEGFRFHSPLCLSFSTSSVGLFRSPRL